MNKLLSHTAKLLTLLCLLAIATQGLKPILEFSEEFCEIVDDSTSTSEPVEESGEHEDGDELEKELDKILEPFGYSFTESFFSERKFPKHKENDSQLFYQIVIPPPDFI
ncbi:MAG: hypothetical protein N4A45_01630 [Flavobacteriales bacterium]|nr:hypothetical protein [Flavobacteriales bacterium]